METKHDILTGTENRELVITRIFDAPRELVFRAWTDPAMVVQWWGPRGFTTTVHEMNVKPGGTWIFTMHGPDGRDYPNKIVFIEVMEPELIIYKHSGDEDTEPVNFHVTVSFEEEGNKTKLRMRSLFESAADLERVIRDYHADEGAVQTMDRLGEFLAKA